MIDAPATGAAADVAAAGPGGQPSWAGSWVSLGRLLLADLLAVVRERFHLLALEGTLFVQAAGALLALGVVAALLVLTAWFVVVAALIALLVHLGLPIAAALLIGAVANLGGAWAAWLAMRRQLSRMTFSASLQALQGDTTSVPRSPPPVPAESPPAMPAGDPSSPSADVARASTAARATTSAMRDDPLDPTPH